MKTMKFKGQTYKINDCGSVPEMVHNMLRQVDPVFDEYINDKQIDDYVCITCGAEIEHNYGTEDYPQCIICGNEPA